MCAAGGKRDVELGSLVMALFGMASIMSFVVVAYVPWWHRRQRLVVGRYSLLISGWCRIKRIPLRSIIEVSETDELKLRLKLRWGKQIILTTAELSSNTKKSEEFRKCLEEAIGREKSKRGDAGEV